MRSAETRSAAATVSRDFRGRRGLPDVRMFRPGALVDLRRGGSIARAAYHENDTRTPRSSTVLLPRGWAGFHSISSSPMLIFTTVLRSRKVLVEGKWGPADRVQRQTISCWTKFLMPPLRLKPTAAEVMYEGDRPSTSGSVPKTSVTAYTAVLDWSISEAI